MKKGTTRLLTVLFAAALLLILLPILASATIAPSTDHFYPSNPNELTGDHAVINRPGLTGNGQTSDRPENNGGIISTEGLKGDVKPDKPEINGGSPALPGYGDNTNQPEETAGENSGDIRIDGSVFPDEGFRNYVLSLIDHDGNGSLSAKERSDVTEINIWYGSSAVKDYTGLSLFPNLKTLRCRNTDGVVTLDVSGNPLLELLDTELCNITELDLTHNPALKKLYLLCAGLTSLDLSGCPALEELLIESPLEALDLSANENLVLLCCCGVSLSAITFGNHAALEILELDGSTLESFPDLRAFPNLTDLRVEGCGLDELDLSGNPKLRLLTCTGNNFGTLDLSGCPVLADLAKNGERLDDCDEHDNGIASWYFGAEEDSGYLHTDFGVELITEAKEELPAPQDPVADPQNDQNDQDEQTDGASDASDLCQWDGKDHGTSFCGRLTAFFHAILFFFARLFETR